VEFFDPDFFCGSDPVTSIMGIESGHPYLDEMRVACEKADPDFCIVAISAQNDFTHPNEELWKADLERVKRWIDIASALEILYIRINAGFWFFETEGRERLSKALEELAPLAHKRGVSLVVENHPRDIETLEQAEQLVGLVSRFDEYGVAACPDNGHVRPNVRPEGWDLLFTAAKHAHVKFHEFDTSGNEKRFDYDEFFAVAEKNKYERSLCIEAISAGLFSDSKPEGVTVTGATLNALEQTDVPQDAIGALDRLLGKTFPSPDDLLGAILPKLTSDDAERHRELIRQNLERPDAFFEHQKELVGKAVELLANRGATR